MTELRFSDLGELLAPFALRPRAARRLSQGTVNSIYRIDTDGGPICLRIHENSSEVDVRYETALLWHLGTQRFPTPQPLRNQTGSPFTRYDGKYVTLFPWVRGIALDENKIAVDQAAQAGEALARFHQATANFAARRDGIYTLPHLEKRLERIRNEPRLADFIPLLEEECAHLHRTPCDLPKTTIHGDLFPDNTLWRGDRLCAVLDLEQASFGQRPYDLAVTLLAWCWTDTDLSKPHVEAFCASYQDLVPFSQHERAAFPTELRTAALRFTITRITDVFLPGADRPGKDFRDYFARLLRLRELGDGVIDYLV